MRRSGADRVDLKHLRCFIVKGYLLFPSAPRLLLYLAPNLTPPRPPCVRRSVLLELAGPPAAGIAVFEWICG